AQPVEERAQVCLCDRIGRTPFADVVEDELHPATAMLLSLGDVSLDVARSVGREDVLRRSREVQVCPRGRLRLGPAGCFARRGADAEDPAAAVVAAMLELRSD